MVERRRLRSRVTEGGAYFTAPKSDLEFIPSGCRVLDCVLGGGWVLGRVANVVGDKSTGKTLLAIEASANFIKKYPKGKVWYREAEAAFDRQYAAALGMPIERVIFDLPDNRPFETVEDMFEDLTEILDKLPKGMPGLYIVDSLDALSDRGEMKRSMDEGSYNMEKQKKLGQLFRRLVRKLEKSRVGVIIVSQERQKIGVTFGEKTTRSGGKALDFYASQIVWLSHLGFMKKTKKGVDRPVGVRIRAKAKKNKVGLPQRECEFELMFGYGTDDLCASLEWLREVKRLDVIGTTENKLARFLKEVEALPDDEYRDRVAEIGNIVENTWRDIENTFLPKRKKYA